MWSALRSNHNSFSSLFWAWKIKSDGNPQTDLWNDIVVYRWYSAGFTQHIPIEFIAKYNVYKRKIDFIVITTINKIWQTDRYINRYR